MNILAKSPLEYLEKDGELCLLPSDHCHEDNVIPSTNLNPQFSSTGVEEDGGRAEKGQEYKQVPQVHDGKEQWIPSKVE